MTRRPRVSEFDGMLSALARSWRRGWMAHGRALVVGYVLGHLAGHMAAWALDGFRVYGGPR